MEGDVKSRVKVGEDGQVKWEERDDIEEEEDVEGGIVSLMGMESSEGEEEG